MNDRYRSLPALSISNNCINLALLKNNCVAYFISANAVSIIEIVLKISLSNANAKDRKFDFFPKFCHKSLTTSITKRLLHTFLRKARSSVAGLKCRAHDQHRLGSKPSRAILLCPWERHFTAFSPCLVVLASSSELKSLQSL